MFRKSKKEKLKTKFESLWKDCVISLPLDVYECDAVYNAITKELENIIEDIKFLEDSYGYHEIDRIEFDNGYIELNDRYCRLSRCLQKIQYEKMKKRKLNKKLYKLMVKARKINCDLEIDKFNASPKFILDELSKIGVPDKVINSFTRLSVFYGYYKDNIIITLNSEFSSAFPNWHESNNGKYENIPAVNFLLFNNDGTFTTICNETRDAWTEDHETFLEAYKEVSE